MKYERLELKQEIVVDKIVTFFYLKLRKNHEHHGEKHDFWEMAYIDKGIFEVTTDYNRYFLTQGECVFYSPNEFHAGRSHRDSGVDIVVISFECHSPLMSYFKGRSFQFTNQERELLHQIIKEGTEAFYPRIDSPKVRTPQRRKGAKLGSEQLVKNLMEILFISLLRRREESEQVMRLSSSRHEKSNQDIVENVIRFMEGHLHLNLTLDEISDALFLSKSQLKAVFRAHTDISIIRYFRNLKIEKVKELIREGNYTFTEIAECLGYSSLPHLTRQFKKVMDMTPSEYAKSVRSRLGDSN